jgi:error-prone DNA polymerase
LTVVWNTQGGLKPRRMIAGMSPFQIQGVRYAELHCKTNYSFLTGASHPDELVEQAIQLDYSALAVTDENSLAGVVRAYAAARHSGMKLIVGAEVTFDDASPVVLWAMHRQGYGQLCRLLTEGRRRAPKGQCELQWQDLVEHSEGLMAGVLPGSSCPEDLGRYRELFGGRGYLLAELQVAGEDERRLEQLSRWSQESELPMVAAGDVLYHTPQRMPLQHVLSAIKHGTTVDLADGRLTRNAQRYLQSLAKRQATYAQFPEALERTLEIADRCVFNLDQLRYEYPEELAPAGLTPIEYLRKLSWEGARHRYGGSVPEKVQRLVEHELGLIEQMRYEAYFLTVWDLVRFARQRHILCQGRGSAANSAVCFCLGVTAVDPATTDVLFERFISRERNEAPDIDIDFEHERREEVLQYLYQKYGRERAGLAATVITYRARSAVRDVGKALGLSLDRVDALAKQVEGYTRESRLENHCREVGIDPDSLSGKWLIDLVQEVISFPRHLSQHVGGMVMTRGPLCELVPIENAAMEDRTVIQWDKDDLEELGILKVDCLCLGMLTAIRKCFHMVQQYHGRHLSLAEIPQEDASVYDMICKADTMGVFQIESRAQMSMLPRLKPRCYYDLVIEVAIVRPGPIQGNMVHPYLRRRAGEEEVDYPNEEIRQVLHKTLGVPIFQEQAMRLAVVAAGFTPGEADQLRRAMGAWRKTGVIERFRQKLMEGMKSQGLSEEFALQVFQQIRGFGEYGFPESHAASFALLVYVSCWLKYYYPAAFTAALINSQPMGFYAPSQLIDTARRSGVSVRPIDVNLSDWDCTLEPPRDDEEFLAGFVYHRDCQLKTAYRLWDEVAEAGMGEAGSLQATVSTAYRNSWTQFADASKQGRNSSWSHSAGGSKHRSNQEPSSPPPSPALRLGLRLVNGLPQAVAQVIVEARRQGPFRSLSEFTRRTGLGRAAIARLADADALKSLHNDRRNALWEALAQEKKKTDQPLFQEMDVAAEAIDMLPKMPGEQEVFEDYRTTGLSLKGHPLEFHRELLDEAGAVRSAELPKLRNGRQVKIAGLVILRQRPSTAKGITFVTLEDESGTANLVLRQEIWEKFYRVARRSSAWWVTGKLEKRQEVIHILVQRVEDLSSLLGEVKARSRDFR